MNSPQPRLDLLPLLAEFATAAIDISDGLVGDLGHVLEASGAGALIDKWMLPVHPWIQHQDRYHYALQGGDDYQILFTVSPSKADSLRKQVRNKSLDVAEIGAITESGFFMRVDSSDSGAVVDLARYRGFNHFAE